MAILMRVCVGLVFAASSASLGVAEARITQFPQRSPACYPYDCRWSGLERHIWDQIRAGKEVDLYAGYKRWTRKPSLEDEQESCDAQRQVSSQFLQTILFDKTLSQLIQPIGIVVKGALFVEKLDLSNIRTEHEVALECSRFEQGMDLGGFETKGGLSFRESWFFGEADLSGVQIGGNANFEAAYLQNIDLHGAHIGHRLNMDGAIVLKDADLKAIQVSSRVSLTRGAYLGGETDLDNAKIGDNLDLSASIFNGPVDLTRIQVNNSVYLGSHLDDSGSITIFENLSKSEGSADSENSNRSLIDLENASIGQNLWLARAQFHGKVSLVGSKIGGQLNLGLESGHWAKWEGHSGELDVRDVSADQVVADMARSWPGVTPRIRLAVRRPAPPPRPTRLHLEGFTYGALCSDPDPSSKECRPISPDPSSNRAAAVQSFRVWLRGQPTVQPYEQLASALTKAGFYSESAKIQFAARNKELQISTGLRKVWLGILLVTIGYGYHPMVLGIWAGILIFFGMWMLERPGEVEMVGPDGNRREEQKPLEWHGFFYTIDMLVPLVHLNEKHYTEVRLKGRTELYFYFLKIMGFILGPAGIAGFILTR
jgi:hypothetical protein